MKVALVHDHLNQNGGAERVLEALQAIWPDAPTYTLIYDKKTMSATFGHKKIITSFLQNIPFASSKLRWFLPLMPTATESYDLSEFDVVISSSSAFAKGIIPPTYGLHICYCHTPTRYLWTDAHSYIQELRAPFFIKKLLPFIQTKLRLWDRESANRVDYFIANSETVRHRIKRFYNRESLVINPPVDVHKFRLSDNSKRYFLTGGRLVSYKRYDLVIKAFNKIGKPLKIFGSGPMEKALRNMAGPNIEFLGRVSDEKRAELFENSIAFIHPQEEDFGITPIEAMSAGRPVIAFRKGGAVETIIDGKTGLFFDKQDVSELCDLLLRFDSSKFDADLIRKHAEQYSTHIFREKIINFVEKSWNDYRRKNLNQF
jgi:glycosyltransferase involved in cell wall biosynthesis